MATVESLTEPQYEVESFDIVSGEGKVISRHTTRTCLHANMLEVRPVKTWELDEPAVVALLCADCDDTFPPDYR